MATFLGYLVLAPSVAWYGAYLVLGDGRWWMFLANSLAHFLFVPVGIVLVAALVFRRRGLLLASLVPTAIALFLFGSQFVPVPVRAWWVGVAGGGEVSMAPGSSPMDPAGTDTPGGGAPVGGPPAATSSAATSTPAAAASSADRLSVMTFNLHGDNRNVDGVMEAILAVDADVVALQEVGQAMGSSLRERVQRAYPHSTFTFRSGWGGLAVLSRHPITPGSGWLESISRGNPQVLILHALFGDVDLINLHNPSLPRDASDWPVYIPAAIAERNAVSESIAAFAGATNRPLLVMGDFNTTERSEAYQVLVREMHDAWREAGFGLGSTFPGGPRSPTPYDLRLPWWLIRIDYVFHSDAFVAERARIGQWDGDSDHRPVVVTLRLRGDG